MCALPPHHRAPAVLPMGALDIPKPRPAVSTRSTIVEYGHGHALATLVRLATGLDVPIRDLFEPASTDVSGRRVRKSTSKGVKR